MLQRFKHLQCLWGSNIFNSRTKSRIFVTKHFSCISRGLNFPAVQVSKKPLIVSTVLNSSGSICVTMSSSSTEKLVVQHDPKAKKFYINLGGEDEAKLEYYKRKDVFNMWHTEVPPSLQGRGIAKILAHGAFEYAVQNNIKMILTCKFLQKYYQDNPKEEYKKLVISQP